MLGSCEAFRCDPVSSEALGELPLGLLHPAEVMFTCDFDLFEMVDAATETFRNALECFWVDAGPG